MSDLQLRTRADKIVQETFNILNEYIERHPDSTDAFDPICRRAVRNIRDQCKGKAELDMLRSCLNTARLRLMDPLENQL